MKLSVTTPRGSVVEADVDEISAPGVLGEFGILPGHVPMLSAIQPGVITYRSKDHHGVLAVSDGFVEVSPGEGGDRILVLVTNAQRAAEVDRAAVEKEASEADHEIAAWKRELDGEFQALRVRRAWAQARLDASARTSAH